MFYHSCHQINNNKKQPTRDGQLKVLPIYKLQLHQHIAPLSPAYLQILMSVLYTYTLSHQTNHNVQCNQPKELFSVQFTCSNEQYMSCQTFTTCVCSCNDTQTQTQQNSNLHYLYCCTVHLVDSLIITQPTNALIVCHLF